MSASALLGQVLMGWLAADLLGGVVHWLEDRVAGEGAGWFGRVVIAPSRLHHRSPQLFLGGSLVDRNLAAWIAASLVSAVGLALLGPSVIWAAATIGGLVSAEVHACAHRPSRAGSLLRVLHEIGALQSPRHHAGHHRPPSDRRYCVLTDWVNPIVDALDLWARLEAALTRIGLHPSKGLR